MICNVDRLNTFERLSACQATMPLFWPPSLKQQGYLADGSENWRMTTVLATSKILDRWGEGWHTVCFSLSHYTAPDERRERRLRKIHRRERGGLHGHRTRNLQQPEPLINLTNAPTTTDWGVLLSLCPKLPKVHWESLPLHQTEF